MSTPDIANVLGECTSGQLDENGPPSDTDQSLWSGRRKGGEEGGWGNPRGDGTCYGRSWTETHLNAVAAKLYIPRLISGSDCLSVSADRRRFEGEVGCGNRVWYNNRKRRSDHHNRDERGLPHLVTTQSTKGQQRRTFDDADRVAVNLHLT